MKKLLTFFLTALLAFGVGWAAEETFVFSEMGYSNQAEVTTVQGTNVTLSFNKGTNSNTPKYYTTGTAVRCYGGNYFIVSSTQTISEIVLTFGSGDGNNAINTDLETYNSGTWTGSASSVKFTIAGTSGHRRIASIKVTYSEGGVTPVEPNVYKKVTSAVDLVAGKKYIVVNEGNGVGMGELNSSRYGAGVTGLNINDNKVDISGLDVMEMTLGGTTDEWTFRMGDNGNYLSDSDGNTNTFFSSGSVGNSATDITKWTITLGDNTSIRSNYVTSQYIRYNSSGNFGTYASNVQSPVALYVKYEGSVDAPTITPNGGNFGGSQEVTLSHDDADAIYYTLDGSTPTTSSTPYSSPFTITAFGTTIVKAIAVKNGVSSSAAEATFTNIGVATLTEANDVEPNSQFIFTGNAVVTYHKVKNGNHFIWLRDLGANSGGGVLYNPDNNVTTQGAVLTSGWQATKSLYNNWIEYTSATGISQNNDYQIQTVVPFDRTEVTLTDDHMNEFIVLNGVTLTGSGNNWTATTESNKTHTLYNNFNVSVVAGKKYNIKGAVVKYNSNIQVYILEAEEVISSDPTLMVSPDVLTISDSGTGNTFTVEGSNLGTDNVGLTQTNSNFKPTLSATTGDPYDGVYNDSPYWGFTPAGGSLNGTVAMEYTGRALNASNTVTLGNNTGASATVTVNYVADLYIVTDNGVTDDWHFDGTYGEHMTNNNGVYTATFTANNPTTFILFARKLGESNPWGTRYVFGPSSGGDWWLPSSGNGNGTIDLNTSHPIRIQDAGTYIVTINANNNTFTITKEVVNEGDFVLVTDDSQLAAGNEVIIVSSGSAGTARTMGQRNNNNYYGTAVTVTNTLKVSPTENTQIFTLEAGNEGWYFKTFDNLYLTSTSASPSSSGNNLNTKAKDSNGTGTSLAAITIGSNNNAATIHFQGNGNRKYLRYNVNNLYTSDNGNDIFSCYEYATSQADVFIYQRSASAEPSITVTPTSLSFVNPADGTPQSQTVTVTESNTTGSTSVSITGTGAASYSATLENGTLTVTYSGNATQANPDVATITLTNGNATAAVEVTGYKLPVVLTITPADGHTFQGSTVSGMIESNVDGATIEYSFDGTNWMTYDSDEGFTATVNEVGGTVTVYARTTVNGETATAQATYTRSPKTATCTADIVFNPTTNGGNMSTWSGLQNHISEGADYVSNATVSTIITSKDNSAMRFGSSSYLGNLSLTLDLTKFEGGTCKLTKVTIVAAAYTGDNNCALNVSTNVNSQGQTNEITAPVTDFGEYVFNFGGDEITTLTIGNTAVSGRVFVRSISLEYSCGSGVSAPVIDPATGLYYSDQTVTITDANENAVIYYTTDGTDPTTSSTQYTSSFVVPYVAGGTTTVKAIAVITEDGEQLLSEIASETYTWGLPSENSLSVIERDLATSTTVPVAVSDRLIGVWAARNILWAKDQSTSIDATSKRDDQLDYVRMAKLKTTEHAFQEGEWDQSNWVMLDFSNINADPFDYVGYEFDNNSVVGYYVDDLNYRIKLMQAPTKASAEEGYPGFNQDPIDENDDHTLNHYVSSNFYLPNLNWGEYDGYWFDDMYLGHSIDTCLFFMNPKIQEIAQVWAVWNADLREFTIYQREDFTVNAYNLDGAFTLTDDQWQYNHRETTSGLSEEETYGSVEDQLIDDAYYIFHVAIMRSDYNYGHHKSSSQPSGKRNSEAIDSQATSSSIVVYPLDLSADDAHNPPTAVHEIIDLTAKDVVSVRYYNLMGVESEKPFEGINIVVTRYADGSVSSSKIMR